MISGICVFNVTAGNLEKGTTAQSDLHELSLEISGDIDISNSGYKILIVCVDIYFHHKGALYTLAVVNKFSCQMTEVDIVKFKEED